jgi:hypothetical protein
MLTMVSREEVSGYSEPGIILQKVPQETLGRKNVISGPNEVNSNSGKRRCNHKSRVLVLQEPGF